MTQKLLTIPLRVGFGAARITFEITAKLVGAAIDIARPGSHDASSPPPPAPQRPAPSPPRQPEPPRAGAPPVNGTAAAQSPPAAPAPPAEVTPPSEQPATPLSPTEDRAKTIDDADEVVATVAETGAQDGAGAQLAIDEPWKGYSALNAAAVIERIGQAGAAELAVLELYEGSHKRRQTVMAAAAKRLRALSPPDIA